MKNTGVVRRIDNLGRLVIPKEIRKTLRINEGDYFEFFLVDSGIMLKKYSSLSEFNYVFDSFVSVVLSEYNCDALIVDDYKIVSSSKNFKNKFFEKNVSSFIEKLIKKRNVFVSKGKSMIDITDDEKLNGSYAVIPCLYNGDILGAIILFSFDGDLKESLIDICKLVSKFIAVYLNCYS